MLYLNVLTALYQSYLKCEQNNLVDRTNELNVNAVLLPIFHTNKRSNNGKDIIEVVLDEDGKFVRATYLEKNEMIIFPVTEDSISRSSGSAPHPLADELSYVTSTFSEIKNKDYLSGLQRWVEFNKSNDKFPHLANIYSYLQKGTLIEDIVQSIYPKANYKIQEKIIEIEGLEKPTSLSPKDFITFKIETLGKDISISKTTEVHQNFIDYMNEYLLYKPQSLCNISGEMTYCSRKHRGLMGNSKLISVSNKKETYYGRFKDGDEIIEIGYVSSQKIHNMLKYLLENSQTAQNLDATASIVVWPSEGVDEFDLNIVGQETFDWFGEEAAIRKDYTISSKESQVITDYIKGKLSNQESDLVADFEESYLFVLIVDKVSNGRISIKYFRALFQSDLAQRVSDWYATTNWQYGYGQYQRIKSPSLAQIATVTHGNYDKGTKQIVLRKDSLKKKTMERLLPCIVDGKKLPVDIIQKMLTNVSNRLSYHEGWPTLLSTACSMIKKYKWDYYNEEVTSDMDERTQSKNYIYGELIAVLEAIETSATDTARITNAEKYWSIFMQSPGATYTKIHEKVRPYLNRLKRDQKTRGLYTNYNKRLEELSIQLDKLSLSESERNKKLNEDFILGYYAQRKNLYTKKITQEEE